MLIENAEYIILCIFGGRIMSSFKVTRRAFEAPPPFAESKKKPCLNRVKFWDTQITSLDNPLKYKKTLVPIYVT